MIVDAADRLAEVRALFLEYAASLDFDLCFQGFEAELAGLPGDYAAPAGCLLLAVVDGVAVGCAALRPLGADGEDRGFVAELKRLYVRPTHRGRGLGRELAEAVVARASAAGYARLRLDTVPSMQAAIRMYGLLGFEPIAPYRANPIEGAAYFEKRLA